MYMYYDIRRLSQGWRKQPWAITILSSQEVRLSIAEAFCPHAQTTQEEPLHVLQQAVSQLQTQPWRFLWVHFRISRLYHAELLTRYFMYSCSRPGLTRRMFHGTYSLGDPWRIWPPIAMWLLSTWAGLVKQWMVGHLLCHLVEWLVVDQILTVRWFLSSFRIRSWNLL